MKNTNYENTENTNYEIPESQLDLLFAEGHPELAVIMDKAGNKPTSKHGITYIYENGNFRPITMQDKVTEEDYLRSASKLYTDHVKALQSKIPKFDTLPDSLKTALTTLTWQIGGDTITNKSPKLISAVNNYSNTKKPEDLDAVINEMVYNKAGGKDISSGWHGARTKLTQAVAKGVMTDEILKDLKSKWFLNHNLKDVNNELDTLLNTPTNQQSFKANVKPSNNSLEFLTSANDLYDILTKLSKTNIDKKKLEPLYVQFKDILSQYKPQLGKYILKHGDINLGQTQDLIDKLIGAGIQFRITQGNNPNHHNPNSWHRRGQALDITPIFDEGHTWDTLRDSIRNNKELTKWMLDNEWHILDETTSHTKKKTGATGDHFHIGRDTTTRQGFIDWLS